MTVVASGNRGAADRYIVCVLGGCVIHDEPEATVDDDERRAWGKTFVKPFLVPGSCDVEKLGGGPC
jgi:hypothetical protein